MERTILSLNQNWRFCRAEVWKEDQAETVCLPHAVRLEPAISSGCRNYQGPCLYRKNIFLPKEYAGKKVFVEFEGAMGVSRLSVNGQLAAEHFCGYTPLVADIGTYLNFGGDNELEVRLDNSDNAKVPPGKPQAHLDFSYDGGLYRDARMIVCEPVYITHPLLANEQAGGGIFVWYSDVSEQSAQVHTRIQVKNETDAARSVTLQTTLLLPDGEVIASRSERMELAEGEAVYAQGVFRVEQPRLWSPELPQLYRLRCEIVGQETRLFMQEIEIGIRTFEFTLHDGVIFNGHSRRFSGANYHQTWPYIGNAVPDSLLMRDMMKLKQMGMENIRSHYPFGTAVTDACNRLGLTLIVSNVGWQFCEPGIFLERALQNMRDIVRWQRNNPCVLIWEPILNESEMSYEIQLAFHEVTHQEYPYAPCYTASDWGPTDIAYCDYDPGMLGKGMEKYGLVEQKNQTERPRWVREYGDGPDNFFDQNSIWRCMRGWGDFTMTESVNRMLGRFDHDEKKKGLYITVCNNKRLCGYGVWPGIAHNRGYHINPCWGGHLDLFRMEKFSYYFMRSQIDRSQIGDVLYIANWWTEGSPADVTVFSNAQRVQLWWNDQLIGEQEPDRISVAHPPFTFKDVKRNYKIRERSVLTAKAIVGDRIVAEQQVKSPGIAVRLKLEADFMGIGLKADGSDIVAVRCHLLDSDGTIVPLTCDVHPILFEIEGEGTIVGDASIGANPVCAEAGTATVLIRSTTKAGPIRLRAHMLWEQHLPSAIKADELIITSQA